MQGSTWASGRRDTSRLLLCCPSRPAVEVDGITFRRPVNVGDLIRFRSWVLRSWPSQLTPGKVRGCCGRHLPGMAYVKAVRISGGSALGCCPLLGPQLTPGKVAGGASHVNLPAAGKDAIVLAGGTWWRTSPS